MKVEIDTNDFCIRLYKEVAYIKVTGVQDKNAAEFFAKVVDEMLDLYPHQRLASLCDLTELVLSDSKVALIINEAIRKLASQLNYKYNAIIIMPKFFQIMRAYIFSFYLKNTNLVTCVFKQESKAINWLENNGFKLDEIKLFLENRKLVVGKIPK